MTPDGIYKVKIANTRRIVTPVRVLNIASGREEVVSGLWDTGAEVSAVSRSLCGELDFPVNKQMVVNGFAGKVETKAVMAMTFPGDDEYAVVVQAVEAECIYEGIDFVIGMDIIEKGEFSLSREDGDLMLMFKFGELFTRLKSEWIIGHRENRK